MNTNFKKKLIYLVPKIFRNGVPVLTKCPSFYTSVSRFAGFCARSPKSARNFTKQRLPHPQRCVKFHDGKICVHDDVGFLEQFTEKDIYNVIFN